LTTFMRGRHSSGTHPERRRLRIVMSQAAFQRLLSVCVRQLYSSRPLIAEPPRPWQPACTCLVLNHYLKFAATTDSISRDSAALCELASASSIVKEPSPPLQRSTLPHVASRVI
jgi:hypothetical protein